MGKKHFEHGVGYLLFPKNKVCSEPKQDESMSDVSKHNSKEKWEGDDSEKGWIGLLVACYTVCLYDFLSGLGEVVAGVVGGKFL